MEMYIVAAGMVSAVGYNVHSCSAALSAAIGGIEELPFIDESHEPLRGGMVQLPQWWQGYQKLVDLLAPAINESLSALPVPQRHPIPLLIGLPLTERQCYPSTDNAKLLAEIERKLELPHHPESRLIPYGQVAGVKALKQAHALLSTRTDCEYCIIAGVDSYLQQPTISYYLDELRLFTTQNSNGFFPAEAGNAVLVSLSNAPHNTAICITGIGEAQEPAPLNSGEIFKAQGMTQAIRDAVSMAGIDLEQAKISLSDLNGEHYKFEELNLALGRFNKMGTAEGVDLDICHPIEFFGEIGAAIIPALLGYAWRMTQAGQLDRQYLLVSAGNDNHERAALIVRC